MSEIADTHSNPALEAGERELCMQCMSGNAPGSHFCRECGAPLSSYAATGPFESLFAEGHAYRRAAEQPRRFIVVFGIWLIFGFTASAGAMLAFMSRDTGGPFGVVAGLGMVAFSVILIAKTTMNYRTGKLTKSEDNG